MMFSLESLSILLAGSRGKSLILSLWCCHHNITSAAPLSLAVSQLLVQVWLKVKRANKLLVVRRRRRSSYMWMKVAEMWRMWEYRLCQGQDVLRIFALNGQEMVIGCLLRDRMSPFRETDGRKGHVLYVCILKLSLCVDCTTHGRVGAWGGDLYNAQSTLL